MGVMIKSSEELVEMRKACQLASQTLQETAKILRPGMTTDEIDQFVHTYTLDHGAIPAPLNYRGFPKSVCTSVNEVVCHGIPSDRVLVDGDIVNIDVTSILNGWHGDLSATFYIGEPSPEAIKVVEVARKSLELGIATVHHNSRLGDIGAAVQSFAEAQGCSVVRDFVGHGIGRKFHEDPQVAHVGRKGTGRRLRKGMTFTIEPMINLGTWQLHTLEDGWTAVTNDKKLSAQFEHTLLVTEDGVEIMTAYPTPLPNSPVKMSFEV